MKNKQKSHLINLASMLLAAGMLIFLALGCSLDLGQKAEPTPTPAEEKSSDDKKDEEDKKESPTPTPEEAKKSAPAAPAAPKKVPPPTGATVGFCTGGGVVLRADATQQGRKVGSIARNQRLYIIEYSANDETINGVTEPWVYVQTEDGSRGWIFGQYVSQ